MTGLTNYAQRIMAAVAASAMTAALFVSYFATPQVTTTVGAFA